MNVRFVEYDLDFLKLSTIWLSDPEIKMLTCTPDIEEEKQQEWFSQLKHRTDYYIRGLMADKKPIGAVGIKNIDYDNSTGEYWGYIGEKSYIGCGIGKYMVSEMCNTAKIMGLKTLTLRVAKYNERAYALYTKSGFKVINFDDVMCFMKKEL